MTDEQRFEELLREMERVGVDPHGFPAGADVSREVALRALRTLPIFFDYLGEDQSFANTETLPLLAVAGIQLPPVERYVDLLISRYVEHRLQH